MGTAENRTFRNVADGEVFSTGGGFAVSSGQTLSGGSSLTAGNGRGDTTIQNGGVLTGGTNGTVGTLSFSGYLDPDAGSI